MNPESSASSIGRRAPMAASQSGNFEARPVASMTRSADLFTVYHANASDMWDTLRSRGAVQQTRDGDTTTDREKVFSDACDRILDRGAATRDGCESFIALSPRAIGDGRRHHRKRVERYASGTDQRLLHVGQMGIEELDCGRVQVVRLAELSDPSSFPRVPRLLWRTGNRLCIALEHSDVMASPSQHHRRREPDNPAA